MTDNEIIKALEDAIKKDDAPIGECFGCVISKLNAKEILDLINRQQAEIETLKIQNEHLATFWRETQQQLEDLEKEMVGDAE